MRNLFLLIAIAVVPARASAGPCPQGYEPIEAQGAWSVCQPITDPQRCEPISLSVCYTGMDFTIGSYHAACQRYIGVLNERCATNKAAAEAKARFDALCLPTIPANDEACTAAARKLLRARQHAREVWEVTERRLRQPISGGGRGVHILF